jgi:hypothetical protein
LSDDIATDRVDIKYVAYTQECPDPLVSRVINDYDPCWEIVCQHERPDNSIRTAKIRTGTGNRHPKEFTCSIDSPRVKRNDTMFRQRHLTIKHRME